MDAPHSTLTDDYAAYPTRRSTTLERRRPSGSARRSPRFGRRWFSSPLQRAVSTAEAIGAAADVRVEVDQRLNDRDYGPWTGQPRAEVEQRFGSVDVAPGVEPADAVAARALAAFIELADEYRDGPLVMVSHDAFNTALLRMLDPALEGIEQRTACYNQLSRSGAGWRVDFYDRKPE